MGSNFLSGSQASHRSPVIFLLVCTGWSTIVFGDLQKDTGQCIVPLGEASQGRRLCRQSHAPSMEDVPSEEQHMCPVIDSLKQPVKIRKTKHVYLYIYILQKNNNKTHLKQIEVAKWIAMDRCRCNFIRNLYELFTCLVPLYPPKITALRSAVKRAYTKKPIGPPVVPFYHFFFGGGFPQNRLQKKKKKKKASRVPFF